MKVPSVARWALAARARLGIHISLDCTLGVDARKCRQIRLFTRAAAERCQDAPKVRREPSSCVSSTLTTGRIPLTPFEQGEARIFSLNIGCRGHPCPRKCETHGGFHIK